MRRWERRRSSLSVLLDYVSSRTALVAVPLSDKTVVNLSTGSPADTVDMQTRVSDPGSTTGYHVGPS